MTKKAEEPNDGAAETNRKKSQHQVDEGISFWILAGFAQQIN